MAGYVPLPGYEVPRNSMLDFSGLNSAVSGYKDATTKNSMLDYQAKQDAAQNTRANAMLSLQQQQGQRQQTEFNQGQQDRAHKALAASVQAISQAPPEQQPQMWQTLRDNVPDFDKDLQAKGVDPNDHASATRMIIAQAQGYQDPLAERYKEAQIKELEGKANYYGSGGGATSRGYRMNPETGMLEFIPGGPADPATIAAQSQARGKGRQFSVSDISKLNEEGTKLQNIRGFGESFQDNYGGYTPGLGDINMAAGRMGFGNQNAQAAAEWWQGYDRYKNEVRHGLFGGALTPNETAQFEKADISPSMDPKIIRNNLAKQKQLLETGIQRKAAALAAAKYDPEVISQAYGLDPSSIAAPQAAPAAAPPAPTAGQSGAPRQAPDGNYYLPDPNRPGKYLRVDP